MKKIIMLVIILTMVTLLATGCNKQIVDFNYSFNRAIIKLPNGQVIDGEISSWRDFDDGDQIQLKINGSTYLTHISNVVMIAD